MGNASGGSYLIGFLIAGAIAFWVYSDAKKRGMNAAGWAAGTFLLCIVFLPLYLIMRKPVVTGPVGMPVPPGYIPPPPPGTYTQPLPPPPPTAAAPAQPAGTMHFCTQCGQRYEGTLKFCPNCGAPQE
jgi:hypothetical protein